MKILFIILIIIGCVIVFFVLGTIARILLDKHARDNCEILVDYTRQKVKEELGFVRIVSGKIRAGKSTLGSGLIHMDELNILEQLQNALTDVREIIHDVNWLEINKDIEEDYVASHDRFLCHKRLMKKYEEDFYDRSYNNYLKDISYGSLLEKYIYAYFRLLDGNYVLSNITKYSFITGKWSKPYNDSIIRLKEVVEANKLKVTKSNYSVLRYTTIFEDEKLLGDKNNVNVSSNFSDDGSSIFYRLIGHLGQETIYYTTTAQNALRWCKNEREIATSIVYINSREVIGNLPFVTRFWRKRQAKNNKRMFKYMKRHFKKDEERRNEFLLNDNKFKQKHMYYKDKLNKIFSESYLSYHCTIYRKVDDIGKSQEDSNGAFNFDLVFPIKWCFASIDSHYFSFLQDYLEGYGKSSYYDLKSDNDSGFVRAQEMLKKHEDNNKKETTKKGENKNESTTKSKPNNGRSDESNVKNNDASDLS